MAQIGREREFDVEVPEWIEVEVPEGAPSEPIPAVEPKQVPAGV